MEIIKTLIVYIIGIASLLCLFIIIISYIIQKSLRTYSFRQIFHLSFATFISTIFYFVKTSSSLCDYQGLLMLWFDLSQYIWSILINHSVHQYTINFDSNHPDKIPLNTVLGEIIIGYALPFAYSLLFYSLNYLGNSGDYCWIKEEDEFIAPILITYSIIWAIIITNIVYALTVISYISRLKKEDREIAQNSHVKLLYYPIIQIIITFPATICRLLLFFTEFAQIEPARTILQCIALMLFLSTGICILFVFRKNIEWIFNLQCFKGNRSKQRESNTYYNDKINNYKPNEILFEINVNSSILDDN